MRFAPTEDQLALAEGIGDLLNAECTPEVVRAAMDAADGRVPGLWAQLAEMGVLALEVPESAGGLGFGPMEMGLVMEAAGRVALPEPLMSTAAVAAPILAASDAPPATAWLERLTSGATVALSLSGQATVHAGSADGVLIQVGVCVVDPDRRLDVGRRLGVGGRCAWTSRVGVGVSTVGPVRDDDLDDGRIRG